MTIFLAVQNQFYYSLPFYLQYPALQCYDTAGELMYTGHPQHGPEYCTSEVACDSDRVDHYKVDYSHSYSVSNWMTDLDMICEPPYKIGLFGSVSFLSFSLGSLLITNQADKIGRKKTVILSSIITSICIACLLLIPLNIVLIYFFISLMGIFYIARASTAYLYCSEFIEKNRRIIVQ